MEKYFKSTNYQDLRSEYRKLAFLHHPDKGGDLETMKEINADYERLSKMFINGSEHDQERKDFETNVSEWIKDKINQIITIEGIQIEICGSWLWITGNTYPVKGFLKDASFQFSKPKTAWFAHQDPYKKRTGTSIDLDSIRLKYGSEVIETKAKTNLLT
jgi:hypothetical protein